MPRFPTADKQLTRYAPTQERPESVSQLTRFKPQRVRTVQAPAEMPEAAMTQDVPAASPAPAATEAHHAMPRVAAPGSAMDLHSETPITVSVLKRALPLRFQEAEADITAAFDQIDDALKTA